MDFLKLKRKLSSLKSQFYLEYCDIKSSTYLAVNLLYLGFCLALVSLVVYDTFYLYFDVTSFWRQEPLIGMSNFSWLIFFINYIYMVVAYALFFARVVKETFDKK